MHTSHATGNSGTRCLPPVRGLTCAVFLGSRRGLPAWGGLLRLHYPVQRERGGQEPHDSPLGRHRGDPRAVTGGRAAPRSLLAGPQHVGRTLGQQVPGERVSGTEAAPRALALQTPGRSRQPGPGGGGAAGCPDRGGPGGREEAGAPRDPPAPPPPSRLLAGRTQSGPGPAGSGAEPSHRETRLLVERKENKEARFLRRWYKKPLKKPP